jgi:hypothetical protein
MQSGPRGCTPGDSAGSPIRAATTDSTLLHSGDIMASDEDLKAEVERLRSENDALKRGAARGISLKVSEKGGVSLYGIGIFPTTLYKEQWTKILDMADEIRAFIAAHEGELKTKG